MKRNAMQDLVQWKNDEERKPMVLKGARQVGKTWIMKEFGRQYYESYVYFNFDEEEELKSIFEKSTMSPDDISSPVESYKFPSMKYSSTR